MKKIFVAIICSFIVLFVFTNSAFAFFDFGGRVVGTKHCLNGIMFTLIPPPGAAMRTGLYIYQWGTLLYKWWRPPRNGLNVLGRALPGGCCWIMTHVGPVCIPVNYSVLYMGTSQ